MAILKIYGVIGEDVTAQQVSNFLDTIPENDKDITVKINSVGGYVFEGWAIHDLLKHSGKNIKTVGEGAIYSIATVVFLAGDERMMYENATGLIHNPFTSPYGDYTSNDLQSMADQLAGEESRILNYYVEKTGVEQAQLAAYMKDEKMLSADEMVTLGFATGILSPVKALAYYKFNNKSKMENEKEKTFMEQMDALLDKAKAIFGSKTKNMVLKTAGGEEVTIEKEEGEVAVGDAAAPDGTFELENGTTIVVAGGVVTEITPAAMPNEELEALKAELEALKAENEELKAKAGEMEAKAEEVESLIQDLHAIKNTFKPESRKNTPGSKVDKMENVVTKEDIKAVAQRIRG